MSTNQFIGWCLSCLLYVAPVAAQSVATGTWRVGGSLQVEHTERDRVNNLNNSLTVHLIPSFGRFISPTTELGFGLGYSLSDIESTVTNNNITTQKRTISQSVPVQLFGKYHWWVAERVAIATRGSFTYRFGWIEETNNINNGSYNSTHSARIGLTPSLLWVINSHLGVEGGLGIIDFGNDYIVNASGSATSTTQQFRLNLSSGITVGVHYFWGKSEQK